MVVREGDLFGDTIVMLGSFNTPILQPAWLEAQGLFEGRNIEVRQHINTPPVVILNLGSLVVQVTESQAVFGTTDESRTLVGALQLIERIHERGALFASVSDGFDITTDTGRLTLRIMLSLAQFELDRSRTRWRDARAEAVERGWHISGSRPFGYRREQLVDLNGKPYLGKLIVDDVEGPLVTEMFQRRAAGESYGKITRLAEHDGRADQPR
jgi:hypothetical protein